MFNNAVLETGRLLQDNGSGAFYNRCTEITLHYVFYTYYELYHEDFTIREFLLLNADFTIL